MAKLTALMPIRKRQFKESVAPSVRSVRGGHDRTRRTRGARGARGPSWLQSRGAGASLNQGSFKFEEHHTPPLNLKKHMRLRTSLRSYRTGGLCVIRKGTWALHCFMTAWKYLGKETGSLPKSDEMVSSFKSWTTWVIAPMHQKQKSKDKCWTTSL